jgi:hypothetical protein
MTAIAAIAPPLPPPPAMVHPAGPSLSINHPPSTTSRHHHKSFPPRRGFEFNFSNLSRQDEVSNSTFQKFPAKTRVRIQLFKSFPPRRGFEFNFSKVSRRDEGSNSTFK